MADIDVALLGTGIMGTGMGRSLRRDGLALRVWNRTRAKAQPLAELGATVVDTAREAIDGADVVVTMLTDGDATAAVMTDLLAHLDPDAVWAQMGTVGVAATKQLARLADQHGVAIVDAPVSGTKQPAEDGKLVVLTAGPADAKARCRPVFEAVGSRTVDLGDRVGDAMWMKMVVNGWLLDLLAGLGESMAFARAGGLDPADFLATIRGGPLDVPYAQLKGGQIIEAKYPTSFPLAHAHKDSRLMLEAAGDAAIDLPVARLVERLLQMAEDSGHGGDDVGALAEVSGRPVP